MMARHRYVSLQIRCSAEPSVLNERYRQRTLSGDRHPGHADVVADVTHFQPERIEDQTTALAIGGEIIEVDTTNFEEDDLALLSAKVSSFYSRLSAQGGDRAT